MQEVRKEAEAALRISKEKMRNDAAKADNRTHHVFKVGDLVMLSFKDVKIHQKSPKLGPYQLGPFKVLEKIGDLDYRLELFNWLTIHDVIHVDRLSPHKDNGLVKPAPPEPEVIEGKEEYKVKEILDSRIYRRQFQYLVKWVGYPGEDTWEPLKNVEKRAKKAIAKFHKEHPKAPRVIKASIYADLLGKLRAPSQHTSTEYSELWEQYPKVVDYDWETSKYL
jgi:hypothetical protein